MSKNFSTKFYVIFLRVFTFRMKLLVFLALTAVCVQAETVCLILPKKLP